MVIVKMTVQLSLIKPDQAIFSKNMVHESFATIDNNKNGRSKPIIVP